MNKDIRTLQDTSENLNTPKAHQEGYYQVILTKNSEHSELKSQNSSSALFSVGSSRLIIDVINMSKNYNCKRNCHQYNYKYIIT